jgi:hypothetical protein
MNQGDKHADPEDVPAPPAGSHADEALYASYHQPRDGQQMPSSLAPGTGPPPDLALLLQQLQSAQGNRALPPGSLLPHHQQQQQQQHLAGIVIPPDASLLQHSGQRPMGGGPPSNLASLVHAMSAPAPPLYRLNPAAMRMNLAALGGQFPGMLGGAMMPSGSGGVGYSPVHQWNGDQILGGMDPNGLGIAAGSNASPIFRPGQVYSAGGQVESSNNHIIQPAPEVALTNRPAMAIFMDCDKEVLTPYQCLLREQIELFEAGSLDIRGTAQGRNTPILLGQVGVRCRHCAALPQAARARGAVYYSQTIDGIYQVAQNMSKVHLIKRCHRVPPEVQSKLNAFRGDNQRASGGKDYWADGIRALGVFEIGRCLRFMPADEESR